MNLPDYIASAHAEMPLLSQYDTPWNIIENTEEIIRQTITQLDVAEFTIENGVAIHKTARIDPSAVIQAPAIIGKNALIGPNTFLRNGIYIGENAIIGFCTEIKTSFVFADSAITHLTYIGDSLVGSGVNLEAGVMLLNYLNETGGEEISVRVEGVVMKTGVKKFGALIGDGCMLGGNAALTPGTILPPRTVVKRLELVEQV